MASTTNVDHNKAFDGAYRYGANRNHKDTVFRDLFGTEEHKANALSLYNALSGRDYDDLGLIELTTIDEVLYMSVKNDISFLINDEMILWEHQSTHNPNMPLRGLNYFARLYSVWAERQDRSVYGHVRIPLPTPRYFVFFVGEEDRPDKEVMRLSDAFMHGPGDVEVTVTVLNVSAGHNQGLMDACKTLADYAYLIHLIRGYSKDMELRYAIDKAVDSCIDQGVLSDYLRDKKAKVRDMFLTEYDEAKTLRQLRDEAIREGRDEGYSKGFSQGRDEGYDAGRLSVLRLILKKIEDGAMSVQDAHDLGFTDDELEGGAATSTT